MDSSDILRSVVDTLRQFDEVVAVGLSGSAASGDTDALSDLDVCVFVEPDVPAADARRALLESSGVGTIAYFDADFDVTRGDGMSINGMPCDLNWMAVPRVKSFLNALDTEFDCDEYVPGGILKIRAIHDPGEVIGTVQRAVPRYPEVRAAHRVQAAFRAARFSFYVLRWLDKAAARGDVFLFLKHEYELLDYLFTALFALNREWFCEDKRLIDRVAGFDRVPHDIDTRLNAAIMHTGPCASLNRSLMELKSLFADLAALALQVHPDLDVATDWE